MEVLKKAPKVLRPGPANRRLATVAPEEEPPDGMGHREAEVGGVGAVSDRLFFRPPEGLDWDDDEAVRAWAAAIWQICMSEWGHGQAGQS